MNDEHLYYTARDLLQALRNMDDQLLDLPLMLLHGKELTKANLVSGLIPCPITVGRQAVDEKKPSLLTFAALN